jgi:hypothetical protein
MPPPSSLATLYCTDEDIVAIAGDDFQVLAGRWFKFAGGSDGVFAPGAPWVLNSASNDFSTQGVLPNMVVQLLKAVGNTGAFPGSGDLLAVESVATHYLTLRRVGEALGVGLPPAPAAGLTGVTFLITSLRRQIEDTAYVLDQQFQVDPNIVNRTPGDLYDQRIFRRLTVYQVMLRRYESASRAAKGDFDDKIQYYREAYERDLDAATVRWGPQGQGQPADTRFSTRIVR